MKCDDRLELKKYRETGLTPETCAEYKKFEDELVSSGKSFKHVIELLDAECEGRLDARPCKVGDIFYSVADVWHLDEEG